MADNSSAATNKLGQLYVEFGTKGLGGVLTGLNGVSAGFLNAASLAQKAVKTTGEFYKSVGQGAVSLQKASVLTNLPVEQLEYLKSWSELNKVSFDDFIGNVVKMQQTINKLGLGEGSPVLAGFQMLGLNPTDYDIDKDPLKLFEDIRKKIREVYQTKGGAQAATALGYFGMDSEMLQIMVNANKELDKSLLLGQDRLKLYGDEAYALGELGIAWDKMIQKAMASQSVVDLTKDALKFLKDINELQDKFSKQKGDSFYKKASENAPFFAPGGGGAGEIALKILEHFKPNPRNITENSSNATYNITNNNTFGQLEDIGVIDYYSKVQAQYNHAQGSNNGGRPNAK